MQPRAVAGSGDPIAELDALWRVHLGPTGFLPHVAPLSAAPAGFRAFADACRELPSRLARGGTRRWLDEIFAVVDHGRLAELEALPPIAQAKILTLCSMLGHGYRWDKLPSGPAEQDVDALKLPAGIDAPWCYLSERWGQPRVGTLFTLVLCNWSSAGQAGGAPYDPQDLAFEDLDLLHSFYQPPEHDVLRAFLSAFILSEARGARIVRTLLDLLIAASSCAGDADARIADLLARLAGEIEALVEVFTRVIRRQVIDPRSWLELAQRPFVWSVPADGVLVEGPSGMQLGVMQCLNTVLDVRNTSPLARASREARRYLPRGQRAFLDALDAQRSTLRRFVEGAESPLVRQRYNACLDQLLRWREAHLARGAFYLRGGGQRSSELTTGGALATGDAVVSRFELAMEERIVETDTSRLLAADDVQSEDEMQLLEDALFLFLDDGRHSADERRLLERRAQELGITPERARQLLASVKSRFRGRELAYLDAVDTALADDATIDPAEREALDALAHRLKIRAERARVLEGLVLAHYPRELSGPPKRYFDEVCFCLHADGRLSLDERRWLARVRHRLGLSEETAERIEALASILSSTAVRR